MRRRRLELPGALALVTGAGSGIGRATAFALADAGARVLCTDRDVEHAEHTAAECSRRGRTAEAHRCDVADARAVGALADDVGRRLGPLDVLVNNAGVGMSGHFLDTEVGDWDWILSVNLLGAIHHCRSFGPAMLDAGRGHVLNVSSALAFTPTPSEPAYVTTKAAVLALSRCLRVEWHGRGVGVSAVCPGLIDTPIVRSNTRFTGEAADPARVARLQNLFSRRGHPPEAVARAVLHAIDSDRGVVTVGAEAKAGWLMHRFAPLRLVDAVIWSPRLAR